VLVEQFLLFRHTPASLRPNVHEALPLRAFYHTAAARGEDQRGPPDGAGRRILAGPKGA
jgi:hypothetical protein